MADLENFLTLENDPTWISSREKALSELKSEIEGNKKIYKASDPDVQTYLRTYWLRGSCDLAMESKNNSDSYIVLATENGDFRYSNNNHMYHYLSQNKVNQLPKYLIHMTQSGWVERAIRENNSQMGTPTDGLWTGRDLPMAIQRRQPFTNYSYTQPPLRNVDLIFDVEKIKNTGIHVPMPNEDDGYVHFINTVPLNTLTDTSIAYLEQVMGFGVNK